MKKKRLLRITTVPLSLVTLLNGQLKFFQENNFEVLAVSSKGPEVEQLKTAGVNHVSISMTRRITPIRDGIALIRLIFLMLKFKPDIVHTHTPKAGLLGMIAAWICRVPVRLHTIAGLAWIESNGFKRWLLKLMEHTTYTCANKVYPNSLKLLQFLQTEMKYELNKTIVLGRGSSNGIDSEYFKPGAELQKQAREIRKKNLIPENEFVFSFVGRVVRDKGVVELVEAFIELNKTHTAWLFMVGNFEPDLDPVPPNILDIFKSNNRIILPGFQRDVRPWLLASDVFVLPSYREGFPNVVLQASCLQLPCIVSNINGCNEIIQDGSSGILVPAKNSNALKDSMQFLLENPAKRIEFGLAAREFVAGNFNQQFVWHEWLKEYNNMVSLSG